MLKENGFFRKKYRILVISGFFSYFIFEIGNMMDSVIAGLFLSETAVSAISLVMPVFSFVDFFSVLASIGISDIFVKKLGEFKNEDAYRAAGTGLVSTLVFSFVFSMFLFLFKNPLLQAYGVSPEIYSYASNYYNGLILFAFFYPIELLVFYLVSSDNDPLNCSISSFAYVVVNALASILLVPRIGTFGLSLGTTLATIVALVILMCHRFSSSNSIHYKLCFEFKTLLHSIKIGSPNAMMSLYTALFGVAINKFIIVSFGDNYLPAYAVINAVISLSMALFSASDSSDPFVALFYSENNTTQVKKIIKITVCNVIVLALIFSVISFVAVPFWVNSYGITDSSIKTWSLISGRIVSFSCVGIALIQLMGEYYPIVEEFSLPNIVYLLKEIVCPLLCVFIFSSLFGFIGVSIGLFIAPFLTILITYVYLRYFKKGNNTIYQIEDNDNLSYQYDFYVNQNVIDSLNSKIIEVGKTNNINPKTINLMEVVIEDSINKIIEKNNKKKILGSLNIVVNKENIRVLLQDDGKIFNLIDEIEDGCDLESYVLSSVLTRSSRKDHIVTLSSNRNVFVFDR